MAWRLEPSCGIETLKTGQDVCFCVMLLMRTGMHLTFYEKPFIKIILPASPERGVFFSSSCVLIVRGWCGVGRWWCDLAAQSAHSHHPDRAPPKLSNLISQNPESLLCS